MRLRDVYKSRGDSARKNPSVDTEKRERQILRQFALLGASYFSSQGLEELDQLVLAQHHGLKTRLLDWTENPLVALWFACANESIAPAQDVYVYALMADELMHKSDIYREDPFSIEKTAVLQPRLNNPRILAQQGWFTLHRFSQSSKRFVPLEKIPEIEPRLYEFRISGGARSTIVSLLEKLGTNSRTLFPDLGGLCQHLNIIYRLDEGR